MYRGLRLESPLALSLQREVHHQNGILHHDTRYENDTDEGHHGERHPGEL